MVLAVSTKPQESQWNSVSNATPPKLTSRCWRKIKWLITASCCSSERLVGVRKTAVGPDRLESWWQMQQMRLFRLFKKEIMIPRRRIASSQRHWSEMQNRHVDSEQQLGEAPDGGRLEDSWWVLTTLLQSGVKSCPPPPLPLPPTARLIAPFCAVGRPISHDTATIFKHVVIGSTHTCDPPPPPPSAQLLLMWAPAPPWWTPVAGFRETNSTWILKKLFCVRTCVCVCVCGGGVVVAGFEERFKA